LRERVDDLEAELADREAADELQALRDDVVELVQRHPDTLDVEAGGRVEQLEAELAELREERDELARQVHEEFEDVDELLAHETVQERIEEVAAASNYGANHTWDAVTALAGTQWVGKEAVVPYMEIGESSTGNVLRELVDSGLVEQRSKGKGVEYRLNREALQGLVDAHRKRERLEAKREEIRATAGGGQ